MILTNITDDYTTYKRISISEFNSLVRCTYQHDLIYRQGIQKIEQPTYFSKGSYLHSLMEQFYSNPKEFNLSAAGGIAKKGILDERDSIVQESDALEIDALVAQWVKDPKVIQDNPLYVDEEPCVEVEFYADIGLRNLGGETVLFHGIIDLVLENEDGTLTVVEHKTASRAWSQVQFQQNYQAPLYAHVVESVLEKQVSEVRFNFFYPARYTTASMYPTNAHKDALVRELQAGVWLRDSGSIVKSPMWGCNGCPVRSLCLLDTQGMDKDYLISTEFRVNEDRIARFAEEGD